MIVYLEKNMQGWVKVGWQLWVYETEFILVLLFIIIYLHYNCKPTFVHSCVLSGLSNVTRYKVNIE